MEPSTNTILTELQKNSLTDLVLQVVGGKLNDQLVKLAAKPLHGRGRQTMRCDCSASGINPLECEIARSANDAVIRCWSPNTLE